jgi:hypothetical protein
MRSRLLYAIFLLSSAVVTEGQQIDLTSPWAAMVATEARIYPNIIYSKAGGYELKLDVITARPDFKSCLRSSPVIGFWAQ